MIPEQARILKGGAFTDARGTLQFVNDFEFEGVKRFYQITHHNTSIVRAWQGHKVEHKWFFVGKGSFVIAWVKIDDWQNPSSTLVAEHCVFICRVAFYNQYSEGLCEWH